MGFGLELALETEPAELPLDAIEGSWPYLLLEQVSKEVVAHEHLREGAKAGPLAVEVDGRDMPASLVTPGGPGGRTAGPGVTHAAQAVSHAVRRGAARHRQGPAARWKHEYVAKRGAEGAAELARRFAQNGEEHLSRVKRRAVV